MRALRSLFTRKRDSSTDASSESVQPATSAPVSQDTVAKSVSVAGSRLVFGLDWRPIEHPEAIDQNLMDAKRAGYSHVAMLAGGNVIGLARAIEPGPGKPHSAVAMLVERFSSGGVEACVLSFGKRVAFVGLMDRQPVPGYDSVHPDLESALQALSEFREIHVDHEIRIATNVPAAVPDGESLQLDDIFARPESTSALRKLMNTRVVRMVVAGLAGVLLIGGAGGWYFWDQERQAAARDEAARQAAENDPNRTYEREIRNLLFQLGPAGDELLDRWREMVSGLPLSDSGWTLQRIDCARSTGACEALWHRNFGNFSDFRRGIGASGPSTLHLDTSTNDVLRAEKTTLHPIAVAPTSASSGPAARLQREALPDIQTAVERWGSELQDLSLISRNNGQEGIALRPQRLFGPPAVTDAGSIQRPVFSMAWQINDDIWSLPSIKLPDNAIPDGLTVQLTPTGILYSLNGSIYAKGK